MERGTVIKIAEGKFPFHFWIQKASAVEESGKMIVEGVASTLNVDHDKERMSADALKSMARIINTTGVPLRVEHSQADNAVIGTVNKAWIDERNQLWIKATLDESHPAAGILYKGLKEGVKMGLSVGGYVQRATQEMVEGVGKMVNTFYDVLLDEVSVTQKPSNYDARLMAKSFAKSEGEVDALASAFEGNEFLFTSAMGAGSYLQAFAKSIPEGDWKEVQKSDYKLIDKDNHMEDTEKKTKAVDETEEKKTKSVDEKDEEKKTDKSSEKKEDDKTEKSVSREEFSGLVKMVSEGFNAMTTAMTKMAKAASEGAKDQHQPDEKKEDPEAGKNVNKGGEEAKDQANPDQKKEDPEAGKTVKAANGDDEDGTREKARKADKEDTYDLETVERAVKAIQDLNKSADETDEKKEKSAEDTETRKSSEISSMDRFVIEVATAIERMEKSMKDAGMQTEHIAKSVINSIRSNPEFRKDIGHFMAEAGPKRSVINGTPFVKMKDGRMFQLTLSSAPERTEKSEKSTKPETFRNLWGNTFSSQKQSE